MDDCSDLVGTPFLFGGRGPDNFDCYGLVMKCSERNGTTLPDFGFSNNTGIISAMMGASLPKWSEVEVGPKAVVLIRIGRLVSHVGYMIDNNNMIHVWDKSGGVLIERIDYWKQRIVGFYKYVGA